MMQTRGRNSSLNGPLPDYVNRRTPIFSATRQAGSRQGQLGRAMGSLQWSRRSVHHGDVASGRPWRSRPLCSTQATACEPLATGRAWAPALPGACAAVRASFGSPIRSSSHPAATLNPLNALGSGSSGAMPGSSSTGTGSGGSSNRSLGSMGATGSAGGVPGTGPDGALDGSAAIASAAVAASVAAAAVAGAVASATPPPPSRTTILSLLRRAVSLLRSNFLVVLLLYAIKDGAAFLLHRVTQRVTNHAAEVLLGVPTSATGNPWWLYLDPAFIRAHPGYEVLIGLFFLACLPFTIALNSAAFTVAALVCTLERIRRSTGAGSAEADLEDEHALLSSSAAAAAGATTAAASGPPGTLRPAAQWTTTQRVGGALYLPPDDPAAAALADLGIHALPTAPPPAAPRQASGRGGGGGPAPLLDSTASPSSASVSASFAPPPFDEPPATASTIAAATSLAAAPPPVPSGDPLGGAGIMDAATTASGDGVSEEEQGGPLEALRAAATSVGAVLPEAWRALQRVWWVDLQFNARALPLQGLCLLVVPALWALPRLLRIQLALPTAVLEGRSGTDALKRSSGLMASSMAAYGTPFAGLLAAGRFLDYIQGVALVLIPPRWWREVVEVPLLIAGAFLLLKAAVNRLQDLLPLAAYLELSEQEAEAARRQQQQVLLLQPVDQQQQQQLARPQPQGSNGAGKPGLGAAAAGAAA